jgi:hypothetical protein
MKIEAGKYYRTRGGDVVGPMAQGNDKRYPWIILSGIVNSLRWNHDGDYSYVGEHSIDLVSEVYVSDTPPVVKDTEAQLREMMRDPRYWRTREPEFVKRVTEGFRALVGGGAPPADVPAPEAKSLRDEFAMEAMKLLIPRQEYKDETFAELAYIQADAMMEARKK